MKEKISLTELQLLIRDSLYLSLPGFYWVVAEISEIKENYAGHCYLELIEKDPDEKNIKARIKAIIWSSRYGFIKSFFENFTGESLRAGIKMLVKAKIEYHEIYGLSLVVTDIDPSYTIGEMAVRRQQILKKLEEEGVLNMNKELDFPFVPRRIAIISSRNAAGYTDFIKHLTDNAFGYKFYTWLVETPMQGNETEQGVINALDKIAANIGLFDLVAIIRGGGSQTDLSWFDNYNIAYYITQFPIPVIAGIGHEKDLSVTDMVAYKSLKTPTAVADFLIECMINAEEHLADISSEIAERSRLILDKSKQKLDNFRLKLIPLAKVMISEMKEELSGWIIRMINIGKGYILKAGLLPANQKTRLAPAIRSFLAVYDSELARKKENLLSASGSLITSFNYKVAQSEISLKILDPVNVLKRGYTITSLNGQILKSVRQVKINDLISTKFSDGEAGSKVVERLNG
jgi:exodeoxyribonuclease VII large subunit